MKLHRRFMFFFVFLFTALQVHTDEIVESDMNHDGSPDAWSYIREGIILRQEFDINFDGKIDGIYIYQADNKVKEEILDTDYDGKMDNWRMYEDGELILDRLDSTGDGAVDIWIYIDRGRIYRFESDTNGDGVPDQVTRY